MLKAGHPAYRAETTDQAVAVVRAEMPDIVLIEADLLKEADSFANVMADACQSFRPVIVAASPTPIGTEARAKLEHTADEIIVGELDAATILFRLEPLARLAIMRNELVLRRQTVVERIGPVLEPLQDEPLDLPVLILAGDSKQAGMLGRAVDATGARAVFSDDPFQAERILAGEECGALVAIADSESRDGVLDLCYQLRKNARLFHLPILLVADAALAAEPVDAYAQGASGVVPIDATPESLAIEIGSHLQRQRRRRMLRDGLTTIFPDSVIDATGLVDQSFMSKHLDTLEKAHTFRRRPLSLAVFAIRNLDAAVAKYGADKAARLHGEVAHWIQRLVRAEDTVAHLKTGEFAVALPNTDDSDARALMHRIDDVLSHTEFGIDGKSFNLWIAAGYAMAKPHETVATFISRARATIGEPQF
jgi:two-component system cell cycle response regulator PopA